MIESGSGTAGSAIVGNLMVGGAREKAEGLKSMTMKWSLRLMEGSELGSGTVGGKLDVGRAEDDGDEGASGVEVANMADSLSSTSKRDPESNVHCILQRRREERSSARSGGVSEQSSAEECLL